MAGSRRDGDCEVTQRVVREKEVEPGPYGIGTCQYSLCKARFTKNKSFQKFCTTNFGGQCRALAWHAEMRKRSEFFLKVKGQK